MSNKFKIPTGICPEAKRFIKNLLAGMEHNHIVIDGFNHKDLTLIAWTYHNCWKAIEKMEAEGMLNEDTNKSYFDYLTQFRDLIIKFRCTHRSRRDYMNIQKN